MCKSDTSVAGSPFNNGTTRSEQTTLFSVFNHIESCAILDATAGILKLGFAEYLATRFGGKTVQADQGSVPNCFTDYPSIISRSVERVFRSPLRGLSHTSNEAINRALSFGHLYAILIGSFHLCECLCSFVGCCCKALQSMSEHSREGSLRSWCTLIEGQQMKSVLWLALAHIGISVSVALFTFALRPKLQSINHIVFATV